MWTNEKEAFRLALLKHLGGILKFTVIFQVFMLLFIFISLVLLFKYVRWKDKDYLIFYFH